MHPLYDQEGLLERPTQTTAWGRPDSVEIRGRYLYWRAKSTWVGLSSDEFEKLGYHQDHLQMASPGRGMLEKFCQLEGAPAERIRRFALQWGMLDVLRWQVEPKKKKQWITSGSSGVILKTPFDEATQEWYAFEPLYIWRFWAGKFASALRTAAALAEHHPPEPDHRFRVLHDRSPFLPIVWAAVTRAPNPDDVLAPFRSDEDPEEYLTAEYVANLASDDSLKTLRPEQRDALNAYLPTRQLLDAWGDKADDWFLWDFFDLRALRQKHLSLQHARSSFYRAIESWQRIARVGLYLNPFSNQLEISTGCLFAGLVWQLMTVVCQATGIAVCSGCHRPYEPERKPKLGLRAYCPECRARGIPVRDAVREHRARKLSKES